MKPVAHIKFGFSDAENYRRRENKDLFNQIFLRTDAIAQLEQPNIFFLVGEKGTGKTAYAVYLSNSPTPKTKSTHKFIRETDYNKFISLKKQKGLSLSEYTDIWKVILLLLLTKEISSDKQYIENFIKYPKFKALEEAINEYYENAFSPEILTALQFIEHAADAAEILAKHAGISAKLGTKQETTKKSDSQKFQINLLYIQNKFQEAISSLNLSKSITLFIDGIDIRPQEVPYEEYLDCIKGLANAAWSLNNDYFPSIKDSQGRLKIITLLRPDIFNSLGLQNRNTKLKDNSILLEWITDYKKHRNSPLFLLADRMFSAQQEFDVKEGETWDYYFPFDATNITSEQTGKTSFLVFLRYSYHRPRDILTMLDMLKELYIDSTDPDRRFKYDDLFAAEFKKRYGQYLLGEIKDSLSFYYNEEEYDLFLKFFEYLHGASKFTWQVYEAAFQEFYKFLTYQRHETPGFMQSPEEFLQFLYDQNILNYIEDAEGEKFIRWCFRERDPTNISPKVKYGLTYEIHYGLANALNTGKRIKKSNYKENEADEIKRTTLLLGKIKMLNPYKKYGFIQQEGLPIDIHFSFKDIKGRKKIKRGMVVSYKLTKTPEGKLSAKEISIYES